MKNDDLNTPYFRSIDEWAQNSEFVEKWKHREFLANADAPEGVSRREFLKMMAGGLALMGLTGCRRPESHIIPFKEQPEGMVPGNPLYFASCQNRPDEALPLIVTSHEGRPTKIEGNARYTPLGGATDAFAQAYILSLYNPDRATHSYRGAKAISKDESLAAIEETRKELSKTQGEGTCVLAAPTSSPSLRGLKDEFLAAYPKAKWVEYQAFAQDGLTEALRPIVGKDLRARYRLDKATRILTLGADILGREAGSLVNARAFAAKRKIFDRDDLKKLNRLYVAESELTITGGQADHRLRLRESQLEDFAEAPLDELKGKVSNISLEPDAQKWLKPMARDLKEAGSSGLVACGAHAPARMQLLTLAINEQLHSLGKTFELLELPRSRKDGLASVSLAKNLILFGVNPVYDAPASLNWAKVAAGKKVLRLFYSYDETSLTLGEGVQVLGAHGLESWGDGRAFDGTLFPQQPLVEPLFDGLEPLEFWARLIGRAQTAPREIARETFAKLTGKNTAAAYEAFLNEGLESALAYKNFTAFESLQNVKIPLAQKRLESLGVELVLRPSYTVGDGRVGDIGWLQELPDPITKLTWGNALWVSPKMAAELGYEPRSNNVLPISAKTTATLDRGRAVAPLVWVKHEGVSIKVPLAIQPGLPEKMALLHFGYGRRKGGRNAEAVGVDAYPLYARTGEYALEGVEIKLTSETTLLASTQNHWSIEGRDHYREGASEDFLKDEHFAAAIGIDAHSPAPLGHAAHDPLAIISKDTPRGYSAYDHPNYTYPQQWGMVLDLGACTGCNACVVACQAENNIPIVGRDQIMRGREMHWIRIDRYYASSDASANPTQLPSDVDTAMQPMLCQHCERAPCEQVCPVNATVHDEQGLNVMAYNRCVGTRYCANNCPYKVRRFNFFDYAKRNREKLYWGMFGPEDMPELLKLQKNPDVTVRSRGVMEKCTFCVQRIEQAKIRQRVKAKDSGDIMVADGVIKTACQQACPTEAIIFGDIADEKTAVSHWKKSPRNYSALGYLNTRPRLTYLARIRNPNRAMPDYHSYTRFRLEQGVGHHGATHEDSAAHGGHKAAHDSHAPRAEETKSHLEAHH